MPAPADRSDASTWADASELPARGRPPRDPDELTVIRQAVSDGLPKQKIFATIDDARRAAKRLRYLATNKESATVTSRIHDTADGQYRLTFTATRRRK